MWCKQFLCNNLDTKPSVWWDCNHLQKYPYNLTDKNHLRLRIGLFINFVRWKIK
jgi:hypothetical protein